jgi:hypothetical protein
MNKLHSSFGRLGLLSFLLALQSLPASAQDLTGGWAILIHEDFPERIPGPDIAEYAGVPLNAAARYRALSWDPAQLAMPEYQCRPHPSDYGNRFSDLRVWRDVDQASQRTTALQMRREWQAPERTIYLDGRARPSAHAQHTWQGFSLGEWDGNMLNVHTTHLKASYVRRNGVPRSDQAEHHEHYIVHDEHLTIVTVIKDPLYLEEPFVRTTNYRLDPRFSIDPYPCEPAVEIERDRGFVPHYLPEQNPFVEEYADRYGLQLEDAMGGASTMYPK